MKIMMVLDRPDAFIHGIWFHRQHLPAEALERRGHKVRQVSMGSDFTEEFLSWPDTVIFGRAYPNQYDPVKWMREFKKRGKRVLYDMDDDFWNVAKDNPSVLVSNALKDQYEGMIKEADAIITPSHILAKKFKKHFKKPIFICPNSAPQELYGERPRGNEVLTIGYMGAASHWKDLQLVGRVLSDLSQKHDFLFTIYGLVGEPLEAAMYTYSKYLGYNLQPEKNPYYREALDFYNQLKDMRLWHVPFMPPELHPSVLSKCDFDIGLAPLQDTEFNRGKSCVKYYEYAAVGTVVLASDVEPYSSEVPYTAKNTYKDWYKKLEKLIVDKDFRQKMLEKQQSWVLKNRSFEAIGLPWELACQQPGGLKVLNQE